MTIRKVDAYGASLGANTFTGAQAAPSLALGGATIGSNALAVTGTANISGTATIGGAVNATSSVNSVDGRFSQSSGPIIDLRTANTVKFFRSDNTTRAIMEGGTLALGGATIGSDALAVTGTTALGGSLSMGAATSITVAAGGIVGVGFALDQQAAGDISTKAAGRIGFSPTSNPSTTPDTAISRISAGIIGVGTGAAGSVAGGLQAATLALGGATIGTYALNVTGTALFSSNFQVNSTISALALGNTGTASNSLIEMLAGGTRISRNVADALSALTVKQTNASSTGNIIDGVNSAGTVFSVSQSGAISVGNTVNSVSPTSPNRTVTIVIGGTTYYLAAKTTND